MDRKLNKTVLTSTLYVTWMNFYLSVPIILFDKKKNPVFRFLSNKKAVQFDARFLQSSRFLSEVQSSKEIMHFQANTILWTKKILL